jgi:hypothetical protein
MPDPDARGRARRRGAAANEEKQMKKKTMVSAGVAVLAVCWLGPAARAAETGPRLSDAQFFSMVDLERPGLEAVKVAAGKADWAAAKRAFAQHLRIRESPAWTFDPRRVGEDRKGRVNPKAEAALEHRLSSIGIEWAFGPEIDWAFNPTTQPDSKWPRNHEWTWQLSRHHMWVDLGRAYYATGDEKYAAEFAAQLKSWVRECPMPLKKADNRPFSRWRTIEAGIRAGSVWPEVYHRFLSAKAFDDEALVLFLKSYAEHALYLMKFYTSGNWLTMEANGLYHAGALFPEFAGAKEWRDTALDRLTRELDVQVYPDGAQVELAPGYHGVSVQNFLGPVNLVPLTGVTVPDAYTAKMERMFDYFLFSMQPTRKTPALNDSGEGAVERWLEVGARLFPQREDFRWVATRGKEGKPPAQTSYRFPYAGQFILRSGWDTQALWLCMDGGPFGYGHQHEDKLGVTLTAYGKALLVEGGVYTYDASEWRRYVLSSRAHNLVMVDGLEQCRRKSPRETYVVKEPEACVWESDATFDHAAAVYEEGWGTNAAKIVRHTRHVFFVKPDLFVIADELEPADGQSHSYDTLFHFNTDDVTVEGLTVATRGDGPSLTVTAFGADGVSIVKGQKEPVVQGWVPDSSGGYGGVRPIPTAIYRRQAAGRVVQLYALCPGAGAAVPRVRGVNIDGSVLTVTRADGTEKAVHFSRRFAR